MSNQLTNEFLAQFNTLSKSGTLEQNESLKLENRQLRRLVSDSAALLKITSSDSMIEYIATTFLDYFMPQFMAFVIQPPREQAILQYCFRNVGRVGERIDESNYHALATFFTSGRDYRRFGDITARIAEGSFTEDFLALNPKLVFPLKGIGGMYGIAIFSEKLLRGEYTDGEIDYIEHLFSILSVMVQNDLHYHSAITDPKTGLYTYDFFVHRIEATLAMVKRYNHTAGMLMLDFDHFKDFNDKWGHLAGDKLLITVSAAMSALLRKEDCLCRFGGEEFAVLVHEIDKEGLIAVAERLRKTVMETPITVNGQQLSITASVGACLISSEEHLTPKTIIDHADQVLYLSKNSGRNCCSIFPNGLLKRAEIIRGNHREQKELP